MASPFLPDPQLVHVPAPTWASFGRPVLATTIGLFFVDVFLQKCVFPASAMVKYEGCVLWSYMVSLLYQAIVFLPLGFLIWRDYGYSLTAVGHDTTWDTPTSPWVVTHAIMFTAYMLRDLVNLGWDKADIMLHHVLVAALSTWSIMEPSAPAAHFHVTGSILEVGSLTLNLTHLSTYFLGATNTVAWIHFANMIAFFLTHSIGAYFCYQLWFVNPDVAMPYRFFVTGTGIGVMLLRQIIVVGNWREVRQVVETKTK
jgi:hypothetical protein